MFAFLMAWYSTLAGIQHSSVSRSVFGSLKDAEKASLHIQYVGF